jgi:hypothetical protein
MTTKKFIQSRNNSKRECNMQEFAILKWIDGHYFSPVLLAFCVSENVDTWKM